MKNSFVTPVLLMSIMMAAPSLAATEAELHSYLMTDYVKSVRPLQNVRSFIVHVVNQIIN